MEGDNITYNELGLFNAATRGDMEYVAKALANKTDPNWQNPDEYDYTALHQASKSNHSAVVRVLMAAGANIELKSCDGYTALYMATTFDKIDVVTTLIDCGADVNSADCCEETPLMAAKSVEVADVLINAHANLKLSDDEGRSALHWAACNNGETVVLLLQKGIDAMKQDTEGQTAADYAREYETKYKEQDVADIIDSFTGTYHLTIFTEQELYRQAGRGDIEYVEKALANKTDPNWQNPDCEQMSAIHDASRSAKSSCSAIVRLLGAAGANLDMQTEDGMAAIHYASHQGHTDAVTALIDSGADINICGWNSKSKYVNPGMTPVMIAAYNNRLGIVETLIDAHANLRQTDIRGQTALHLAVDSTRSYGTEGQIVHLMLHKGIAEGLDVKKQDHDGKSAADYAREDDMPELADIIDNFITSITQPRTTDQSTTATSTAPSTTAASTGHIITTAPIANNELDLFYAAERGDIKYVDNALANKTDPNWQNPDRKQSTALHRASRFNHSAIITSLKAAGANIDLQDEDGETPIYLASKTGQIDAVTKLIDCGADINIATPGGKTPIMVAWPVKVVDALIDAHAILSHTDNLGRTALHWAIWRDQLEKVPLLLQKGIDATKQDITGLTAADYARNLQHHELLDIIDSFTTSTALITTASSTD